MFISHSSTDDIQSANLSISGEPDRSRAEYLGKALQRAAGAVKEEIVHLLLQSGADVLPGTGINRPSVASRRGNLWIARLLLDTGADMNVSTALYRSALQEACSEAEAIGEVSRDV
jgi:ankyrin repeat protein